MTTGVLLTALGLVLRLLAVALPGMIVFATTDPTDLADALVQNAKAPARFAIGALAAFRLVPLLGQEWQMLSMARRARGVDAGRNPVAELRLFASTAFALLVGAIRRGTRLAVAMDARGFDAGTPRTVARRQRFGPADALLIAGAVVLAAAALTTSVAPGHLPPPDQLTAPPPPAARRSPAPRRRPPPAARRPPQDPHNIRDVVASLAPEATTSLILLSPPRAHAPPPPILRFLSLIHPDMPVMRRQKVQDRGAAAGGWGW